MSEGEDRWSVGEVATRSGVTVRALHHYDHLGLLRPDRDGADRRSYSGEDLARLYRITVLRRLGIGLSDIATALDSPDGTLAATVSAHLEASRHRALAATRRAERAAALADQLDTTTTPDPAPLGSTTLLVYDDLAAAHQYLVSVLGLTAGPVERSPSGEVVHAEVRAGSHVIWMPATTCWTSSERSRVRRLCSGGGTARVCVPKSPKDSRLRPRRCSLRSWSPRPS